MRMIGGWKDLSCSLNMTIISKTIYKITAISVKILMPFHRDRKTNKQTNQTILTKAILSKEINAEEISMTRFQIIIRSYSNKDSMVLAQTETCRTHTTEAPDMSVCSYSFLKFDLFLIHKVFLLQRTVFIGVDTIFFGENILKSGFNF